MFPSTLCRWNNVAGMRLVVVRHGIAKSKRTWKGRDKDRPLTVAGMKQAKAVSARFGRYGPDRMLSSPSLRCIETMTPLATARGLRIEKSAALGPDAGDGAVRLVRRLVAEAPASSTVVICTHREVIVRILPTLASQFGVRLGHRLPGAKGSSWILTVRDGHRNELKYWRTTR